MGRPFIPKRLESPKERDDRVARQIFREIEDGGERIAQIFALALIGGGLLLVYHLWQTGVFDPK